MNVQANNQAILKLTHAHSIQTLIHGHTHNPTIEYYPKTQFKRYVLADWDKEQGHYLQVEPQLGGALLGRDSSHGGLATMLTFACPRSNTPE